MNTAIALLNRRVVSCCHDDHAVDQCLNVSWNCRIANLVPASALLCTFSGPFFAFRMLGFQWLTTWVEIRLAGLVSQEEETLYTCPRQPNLCPFHYWIFVKSYLQCRIGYASIKYFTFTAKTLREIKNEPKGQWQPKAWELNVWYCKEKNNERMMMLYKVRVHLWRAIEQWATINIKHVGEAEVG